MASPAIQVLNHRSALSSIGDDDMGTTTSRLSILSYNVLLPNSQDGWWLYKMYSPRLRPPVREAETEWPFRQGLLQQTIAEADADVVCLQETAEGTFEDDWAFMAHLGYTQWEIFKRGRFRPATFWRPDRVQPAGPPIHRDRCLITPFRCSPRADLDARHPAVSALVYVVNCHLTAGPEAPRRLRQIHDACETIRKDMAKNKKTAMAAQQQQQKNKKNQKYKNNEKEGTAKGEAAGKGFHTTSAAPAADKDDENGAMEGPGECNIYAGAGIVFIGDLNADASASGVGKLLREGAVDSAVVEDGVQLVGAAGKKKSNKTQTLGRFLDCYESVAAVSEFPSSSSFDASAPSRDMQGEKSAAAPPPTLVVEQLIPRFFAPGEGEVESSSRAGGAISSAAFVGALRSAFESFAVPLSDVIQRSPMEAAATPPLADPETAGEVPSPAAAVAAVVPLRVREVPLDSRILGLRQRVLWPRATIAETTVPGDVVEGGGDAASGDVSFAAVAHLALFEDVATAMTRTTMGGALGVHEQRPGDFDDGAATAAENDADDASDPVAALSLYGTLATTTRNAVHVQLRKFATEPWARNRGYGSLLLAEAKAWTAAFAEEQLLSEAGHRRIDGQPEGESTSSAAAPAPPPSPPPPPPPPPDAVTATLWCDARLEQEAFYAARGFKRLDAQPPSQHPPHTPVATEEGTAAAVAEGGTTAFFWKRGLKYVRMECPVPVVAAPARVRGAGEEDETPLYRWRRGSGPIVSYVGACDVQVMDKPNVCRWLTLVNGAVGRGSEFRYAAAKMGWTPPPPPPPPPAAAAAAAADMQESGETMGNTPTRTSAPTATSTSLSAAKSARPRSEDDIPGQGVLTWSAFKSLYEEELRQGKYWGVNYDLAACGSPLPLFAHKSNYYLQAEDGHEEDEKGSAEECSDSQRIEAFSARYDAAFVGSTGNVSCRLAGVRDTLPPHTHRSSRYGNVFQLPLLPNAENPSDHLPIGIVVDFSSDS